MQLKSCALAFACTVFASGSALAQGELNVYRGSLVAAQAVTGRVAVLPDSIVFIDDEKPEASFFATRAMISAVTPDTDSVTIQLNKAVKDRSGSTTRVILRLTAASEATAIQRWFSSAPAAAAGPQSGAAGASANTLTFRAQKKKMLRGNTDGKLIIDDTRIMFESTDNASDSRRWELKEIKELKNKNPYELEIRPFRGENYELQLTDAMDQAQFREIVDRVTKSRTARQ
ncbi:MAG: hypothetical protein JNK87_21365 [Bryobacterales bacterium]|nr:hypothetical protein [Bryobacterales bacterium]